MRDVPATLGRYEIGRRIGAGASGEVYLAALHGAMGFQKRLALKVFADDRPGADPRRLGQFVNEGMLGEHLQHPNIVSVVEFGEHEGRFFLVMEYIDGISLRGVFELCAGRGVALPEEAVAELGVQVCAGLDHAHRATGRDGAPLQLVHRDLKPANLILDPTGTVRILDFGVARVAASPYYTTALGEIRGTPAYMTPEQVRATDTPTPALDVYALGLVLCEAATGQPVFVDHDIESLLEKVLAADAGEALVRLEERAPGLVPIAARALKADPEARYPTAAVMGDELRQLWMKRGGRARLAEVARATLGLRPDRGGDGGGAPPRRGEPTLAVPAVREEPETGPIGWARFTGAFVDQLGEDGVAAEEEVPASPPPERRLPGWWIAVAVVAAALLVPAVGIPLYHAVGPDEEDAGPVVVGGAELAEAETPGSGLQSAESASHGDGGDQEQRPSDGATEAERAVQPVPPGALESDRAPGAGRDRAEGGGLEPETGAETEAETETELETGTRTEFDGDSGSGSGADPPTTPAAPLPPLAAGTGSFSINSRPWAEVWLDGQRIGRTGAPSFVAPAGRHTVELVQPASGARKSYDVDIPVDATVKLGCWDFRAEARCGE